MQHTGRKHRFVHRHLETNSCWSRFVTKEQLREYALRVGIRREDKNVWERRTPLTPAHVEKLIKENDIEVIVQPSNIRCFSDEEYKRVCYYSVIIYIYIMCIIYVLFIYCFHFIGVVSNLKPSLQKTIIS